MVTKKYRSIISVYLSIGLLINGKSATIDFIGGANGQHKTMPYFITSDPDVQKALDTSPGLNVHYRLESVETTPDEQPEHSELIPDPSGVEGLDPSTPAPVIDNIFNLDDDPPIEPATGDMIVSGITNAQDAKAYLSEMFPGKVGQMPNKSAVLSEAIRLKVSFPDWK